MGHVDPDLVRAPGLQPALDQRAAGRPSDRAEALQHLVVGDGVTRVGAAGGTTARSVRSARASERRVDAAGGRLRLAPDKAR
jgi:hypothetical protein